MGRLKIIGIVLVGLGVLWIAYGDFTYTRERHATKVGPMEFSVKDEERVVLPDWVGVGAVAVGGALLIRARRERRE